MIDLMRNAACSALLLAAASGGAGWGAAAQARVPASGDIVRDSRGEVLGRIESVVADSAGRPVQVRVRSRTTAGMRSEVRALPASSLRPSRDGFSTPLRKAEFEVLPPARR